MPTPTPSATPAMLSSGSSGDEVKALQSRLQQLGFYSGVLDGDYGKGTRAAEALFALIAGEAPDPRDFTLPVELVVRGSTARVRE